MEFENSRKDIVHLLEKFKQRKTHISFFDQNVTMYTERLSREAARNYHGHFVIKNVCRASNVVSDKKNISPRKLRF